MYDLYKPLRNHLRKYDLVHTLLVAYNLTQHLQFGNTLAPAFRAPQTLQAPTFEIEKFSFLYESLTREAVLNCATRSTEKIDTLPKLRHVLSMMFSVENEVDRRFRAQADIMYEMLRIAHRQFPWQRRTQSDSWIRYFKIYNHREMRPLVEAQYGMTTPELYQIGLSVSGHFLENPVSGLTWPNEVNSVGSDIVERFFDRFSRTIDELRRLTNEKASYDVNWAYSFNPLRLHPLVRFSHNYVCPIPTLLIWRLTEGLYFDVVGSGDSFSQAFGNSFQDYVGEVLDAANDEGAYRILAEAPYGRRAGQQSVDWIVEDGNGTLFIECKAPRLLLEGKIDLKSKSSIDAQLEKLGSFVGQTYKTLSQALEGRYPHWKPDGRPVFPMIVTLDDWQAFGPLAREKIDSAAAAMLRAKGCDVSLLEKHPYAVCPIPDFERAIQVMAVSGFCQFMTTRLKPENRQSLFAGFLAENFGGEIHQADRELFPSAWQDIDPRL